MNDISIFTISNPFFITGQWVEGGAALPGCAERMHHCRVSRRTHSPAGRDIWQQLTWSMHIGRKAAGTNIHQGKCYCQRDHSRLCKATVKPFENQFPFVNWLSCFLGKLATCPSTFKPRQGNKKKNQKTKPPTQNIIPWLICADTASWIPSLCNQPSLNTYKKIHVNWKYV